MMYASSFSGMPSSSRSGLSHSEGASDGMPSTYRKRGKLPKAVTDLLKTWLLDHATHPYPTDDEKRRLCSITGLAMSQVSNWFINARRRILVPNSTGGFAVGTSASASLPMQGQQIHADRLYGAQPSHGPPHLGQPYVSHQQHSFAPVSQSRDNNSGSHYHRSDISQAPESLRPL
ncbi:hypothetical protein IE81DRAFT_153562 [Ceraceosorus guamensis]|uniref:Homeobox domain-containing protein n=1 Tax=Ceraceosorus guamensis TaxID=1522189 RepID=A0A316VWC1_9BASI|nr:hypothetical protein IE81DRAFT_153562 [Ceraceosorus guamensis]PWN41916.1 hypothetical protein IE81DRAFT_153562 [Ceraceosorus guamensis]